MEDQSKKRDKKEPPAEEFQREVFNRAKKWLKMDKPLGLEGSVEDMRGETQIILATKIVIFAVRANLHHLSLVDVFIEQLEKGQHPQPRLTSKPESLARIPSPAFFFTELAKKGTTLSDFTEMAETAIIVEAIKKLKSEGKHPSSQNVGEIVGKGESTINTRMNSYRIDRNQLPAIDPGLSNFVVTALNARKELDQIMDEAKIYFLRANLALWDNKLGFVAQALGISTLDLEREMKKLAKNLFFMQK